MNNPKAIFESIYRDKTWFNGSGSGSAPENTASYRHFLEKFLVDNNILSVLDLGCGDWQSSSLVNWASATYVGVDVVPELVALNNTRYGTDKIKFLSLDFSQASLPQADLIIIKDVFQHWPNNTIQKFADKLKPYRTVLITNTVRAYKTSSDSRTATDEALNSDIQLGEMRPIDLGRPPFSWAVKELHRYDSIRKQAQIMEEKSTVTMVPDGS